MNYFHSYIDELKLALDNLSEDVFEQVLDILHKARMDNQQVFILGNGGSASTASHFVCDLGKNTRIQGAPNFRVMGLTDNIILFSALANDEGYENVFAEQIANYLQPDDVVIGISTSGNSQNVINAIQFAKSVGAKTIGFTGFNSGKLGPLADVDLHVSSHSIEHVEDVHLVLEHLITKGLREKAIKMVMKESSSAILVDVSLEEAKSSLERTLRKAD
jgi:D-sedoheptulose 7-phosphate isomerase